MVLAVAFAPLSVESYQVIPSVLTPGQQGVIQITLQNVQPSGSTTVGDAVESINIYFASVEGLEFISASPVRVGTIESGVSSIASITVRVLPTAPGGIVSPMFSISQQDVSVRQTLVVPIIIENPPILTLTADKQTIRSTDTINLTITNNGGAITQLTIKLNNTDVFSLIGTDQIFVGELSDSTSVLLPIDSRNAEGRINSIPLLFTYRDEGGVRQTELKPLSITVQKEEADIVFTQQSTILTSQDNLLELKVRNTGSALKNLRIIWEDEGIQAKELTEVQIGDLAPGEERVFTIHVFADAEPGVYNTDVELQWVEENVEKEEDTTIPLVINSDADVGIFIDARPTPLAVGGEYTLSVLASNIGSYRIENVELALQEGEILEILNAQTSQYIGGLDNDDFSTVQYKIRVRNIEPGSYPLIVHVRYKDSSGIWIEKNISRDVIIRSASEAGNGDGNSLLPYAMGIFIVALAYWYYKKKLKPKKPLPST